MVDPSTPSASQPKTSWGLAAFVRGKSGEDLFQKLVVKTALGDYPSLEEEDAARIEASRLAHEAIMANETLRRFHQPQLRDGMLHLTNPILNTLERVTFESVLIVEPE